MQDYLEISETHDIVAQMCHQHYRPGAEVRVAIEASYSGIDLTEELGL